MRSPLKDMSPIGFTFKKPYPPGFGSLTGKPHLGVDILAPEGTPVFATEDGQAKAFWGAQGGNTVELVGTYTQRFMHLRSPGKSGYVRAGDVIGYSGNTGTSNYRHLHWDARGNGTGIHINNFVDPLSLITDEQEGEDMDRDKLIEMFTDLYGRTWKVLNSKDPNLDYIKREAVDAADRYLGGERYAPQSYIEKYINEKPMGSEAGMKLEQAWQIAQLSAEKIRSL